jgi:hypothetical protein
MPGLMVYFLQLLKQQEYIVAVFVLQLRPKKAMLATLIQQ